MNAGDSNEGDMSGAVGGMESSGMTWGWCTSSPFWYWMGSDDNGDDVARFRIPSSRVS